LKAMNCDRARTEIFGPAEPALAARRHVEACELCQVWLDDARLIQALRAEPIPEPSAGFVDRALQRASQPRPARFAHPALAAAAAVLLAVAAVVAVVMPGERVTEVRPVVESPILAPRIVNVVIDAKDDRPGTLLRIELTEDLELEGFANQQSMEWRTDLTRGRNLLALPVRSKAGRGGDIHVALRYADRPGTELRIAVNPG
jgi:hypothetical protein